jgi:hypothetical protein
MDKPSPNNPHLHDWLGTPSFAPKPFDPTQFDARQVLEAMSAGFGPMKALTVQQMELVTLASRRAQAYLAIPQRLSRCRTHQDLLNEQMRFWQTAMSQYQDSTTRIANAWSELFAALPTAAAQAAPAPGVTFPARPSPHHSADPIRVPANVNSRPMEVGPGRSRRDQS